MSVSIHFLLQAHLPTRERHCFTYSVKGVRKLSRKGYNSNNIRGKLRVYDYLIKDRLVKPYLPITKAFNEFNLKMMLNQFSTVYIKPEEMFVFQDGNRVY